MTVRSRDLALAACLVLCAIVSIQAYSSGAGGCSPGGSMSGGEQGSGNPFTIEVLDGSTPVTAYTPGSAYTVRLTAGSTNYKGFLFRETSGKGSYENVPSDLKTTSVCGGGVTQRTARKNSPRSSDEFSWRAPSAGSGTANFNLVGVVSISQWWASSPATLSLPETACTSSTCENGGTCVDSNGSFNCTCPSDVNGPTCNNTAPVLTCPSDQSLVTGGASASFNFSVAVADAEESGLTAVCSVTAPHDFPAGLTTVTCNSTDNGGLVGECSFSVNVSVDSSPPSLTCPPVSSGNDPGLANASVAFSINADDDFDTNVTVVCSPTSGSVFSVGTSEVSCNATDDYDNSASCAFNVTVSDIEAPDVTCANDISNARASADLLFELSFAANITVTDNVDTGLVAVCNFPSPSNFSLGTTTIECNASDTAGNTGNCSFEITVIDENAPNITACPADIVASTDTDSACKAAVTWDSPSAIDRNDAVMTVPTPVSSPTAGLDNASSFCVGVTTVTYTFTDAVNQSGTCMFTVSINDNQAPDITCPSDITAGTDVGLATSEQSFSVSANDAVSNSTAVVCSSPSPFNFSLGASVVSCNSTDAAGNTARCNFTVTISDDEAPVVICPIVSLNNPTDTGVATYQQTFSVSVNDNVDTGLSAVCSVPSPGTFAIGNTTVVCNATDAAGNTGNCTFTVGVQEPSAPAIVTCPTDIAEVVFTGTNCTTVSWGAVGATDKDGATMTVPTPTTNPSGLNNGSSFCVGVTEVTYNFTDAISGKSSVCQFSVNISESTSFPEPDASTFTHFCQLGPMAIRWSVGGTAINFRVEADITGGQWFGMGPTTSGRMINAYPILNVGGASGTVLEYSIGNSRNLAAVNTLGTQTLTNKSAAPTAVTVSGGKTSMWFSRPINSSDYSYTINGPTTFIWSIGKNGILAEHDHSGSREGLAKINLATGNCEVVTVDSQKKSVHGILMTIGLGMLMPIAVMVARFDKTPSGLWFKIHVACVCVGTLFGVIAFALIYDYQEDNSFEHFRKPHSKLGMAVLAFAWFQFVLGVFRPKHGAKFRPAFELIHKNLGRILMVAIVIAIFSGMREFGTANSLRVLFGVWVGLYCAVFAFRLARQCMNKNKGGNVHKDSTSAEGRRDSKLSQPTIQLHSTDST